jgi:protein-S-isoprenylcysteine O-methyltransferase Ste14
MKHVVFVVTLIAEILATVSVGVSIASPDRRIWPPEQERSWTGILMWLFFTVSGMGVIALGILDRGSLNLPLWLRWGMGMPLWIAGNGLALWAVVVLGMAATFGEAKALIQRGPYRRSRNPQYVGFIAGLMGWAMVSSSTMTLGASLVGVLPLVLVPFAEEPWLVEKYGAAYKAYQCDVPRFIGRFVK